MGSVSTEKTYGEMMCNSRTGTKTKKFSRENIMIKSKMVKAHNII